MSTIQEMGAFLSRETNAVAKMPPPVTNGHAPKAPDPTDSSPLPKP